MNTLEMTCWGSCPRCGERGESLEETLVRELREELSLSVSEPVYLSSFASEYLFRDVLYQSWIGTAIGVLGPAPAPRRHRRDRPS